jgi:uncharacterized membrane protein YhhN
MLRRALPFAPFVVVSLIHLAVKLFGLVPFDQATKPLLMPMLILGIVLVLLREPRVRRPSTLAALLAGVGLSWLGDVTLVQFEVGLGFFVAAHIAYVAAFATLPARGVSAWGLLVVPWFAALVVLIAPVIGPLLPLVAVYGAVLAAMAVAATRGNWLSVVGGVLFIASDTLLAFRLFTPLFQTPPEDVLIMGLYLAAQALLTGGLLRASRTPPRVEPGVDRPTTDEENPA